MRFCYAAQPLERAAEHPTGLENSLHDRAPEAIRELDCVNVRQLQSGAVAQLGERLICIQEVVSSILISSTKSTHHDGPVAQVVRAHP